MKLSDFTILFAIVFLSTVVALDFRWQYIIAAKNNEIMYNRIMDRIDEDVLFDLVMSEKEDGEACVDADILYEKYAMLIKKNFDITDDDARLTAAGAVSLQYFSQYRDELDASEVQIEIDRMTDELTRKDIQINVSYARGDEYTQTIYGPSFITVFDPYDRYKDYDRIMLSGARIKKRNDED